LLQTSVLYRTFMLYIIRNENAWRRLDSIIMDVTSTEWGKIKNYYDCKLRDGLARLLYSTTLGQNLGIYPLLFTLCFALPRQRRGRSILVHKSSFEQACSKRYLKNYDMHIYNFNNELKIVIFVPDFFARKCRMTSLAVIRVSIMKLYP